MVGGRGQGRKGGQRNVRRERAGEERGDGGRHRVATGRLVQEVVRDSGEYPRRCRRLKVQEDGEESNEETRNSAYCKQQLIHSHKLSRQKHFLSDHRISQNISFPR